MRTDQEILAFHKINAPHDILGTYAQELISRLPFKAALPYMTDEARLDEKGWEQRPRDEASIKKEMAEYIDFAFGKAIDHRGISAGRSIAHFACWLFLLGDSDMLAFANDEGNYPQYGAPILVAIAKKYGFSIPENKALALMAEGKCCGEYVGCGCA